MADKDVHEIHPSLANLGGTINNAKTGLSQATVSKDYKVRRVDTAQDLKSGNLKPFKHTGEKHFRVLFDGIALYEDKQLNEQAYTIILEKDAIVSGTYLYNDDNVHVVLLGNPYNVYCKSNDVEPEDIIHSDYIEKYKDKDNNDINTQNTNNNSNDIDPNVAVVGVDNNKNDKSPSQKTSAETLLKSNDMDQNDIDDDNIIDNESDHDEPIPVSVPLNATQMNPTLSTQSDDTVPQTVMSDQMNSQSSTDNYSDNIAIQEARSSHILTTPLKEHNKQYSQSISATIPSLGKQLSNDYPTNIMKPIEEKNPSFIHKLPGKKPSSNLIGTQVVSDSDGKLHFEPIDNEQQVPAPNYHQQAMDNKDNPNLNVSMQNQTTPNTYIVGPKLFFNNFFYRTLVICVALFVFSLLSFPEWFRSVNISEFNVAYGLSAFGIFIIWLSTLCCIIGGILQKCNKQIPFKQIFIYFVVFLYLIGGIFYFIGGCVVANAYYKLLADTSYSCIWFTEVMYISLISIILACDIYKQYLNRWDIRVCVYIIIYILCALILSFSYLIIGNQSNSDHVLNTIGIGYLLSSVCGIIYLIIRLFVHSNNNKYNVSQIELIELIIISLLMIFIFITSIGYLSLSGEVASAETGSYYVGMAFFQLIFGVFMTCDITFCQYIIPMFTKSTQANSSYSENIANTNYTR